ncbi:hypothetical protein GJAV_G00190510 [Gymnothorax javanicus]|nr:hypothetical protein GJAV_G00190510 [Gymnothorax javanicus]
MGPGLYYARILGQITGADVYSLLRGQTWSPDFWCFEMKRTGALWEGSAQMTSHSHRYLEVSPHQTESGLQRPLLTPGPTAVSAALTDAVLQELPVKGRGNGRSFSRAHIHAIIHSCCLPDWWCR